MAQIPTQSPLPIDPSLSVGRAEEYSGVRVGSLQKTPPQARKPPKQGLQAWRKNPGAVSIPLLSILPFPACAHDGFQLSASVSPDVACL